MAEAVSIQTARLKLRTLHPGDRDKFVRSCEESWEFWDPWMPARGAGETFETMFQLMLERTEKELTQDTGRLLAGFASDGRMVGIFALFNIVRGVFQNGNCGWRVAKPFARQGYATEALGGLLDFAFTPAPQGLGLHRVQANVIPDNVASVRLAEKMGFRREGLGKNYLRIAGEWRDHIMFAKLADEHQSMQPLT